MLLLPPTALDIQEFVKFEYPPFAACPPFVPFVKQRPARMIDTLFVVGSRRCDLGCEY